MPTKEFKGFGGIVLRAKVYGHSEDPAVLFLHEEGRSHHIWSDAADALCKAGRYVINLDLRGHGESDWAVDGRYDFDAFVEDLRSVLAQLAFRPVIIGHSLGGWIGAAAIGEAGVHAASGLILVDAPIDDIAQHVEDISVKLTTSNETPAPPLGVDPAFSKNADLGDVASRVRAGITNLNLPLLEINGAYKTTTVSDEQSKFHRLSRGSEFFELSPTDQIPCSDRSELLNAALLEFLERRIPRFLPDYRQGSDARTLRDALGCFATGVTVVTTISETGEPVGLTANSFTSVSLDPPLLLVCVAKTSSSLKVLEVSNHFAVNVLHIGQQPVSNVFAKTVDDRFGQVAWQPGMNNSPLLAGALANFECDQYAIHDGGDHVILLGRVTRAKYEPRRDPLLYFRGKYRRLHFA